MKDVSLCQKAGARVFLIPYWSIQKHRKLLTTPWCRLFPHRSWTKRNTNSQYNNVCPSIIQPHLWWHMTSGNCKNLISVSGGTTSFEKVYVLLLRWKMYVYVRRQVHVCSLYLIGQCKSTGGYLQRPGVGFFRTGAGQNAIRTVSIMFVRA